MVSTGNKTLFLIIVFLSLFAIFSSSLFVNKGSSQGLGNFLDRIFGDDGDDQGEHGDDGDDQGENGDDGNRGNRGNRGDRDDRGDRREDGDRGDRGDLLKKLQKAFKDRDKDKDDMQEPKKEESFVTKDYKFADEGEEKRKNFNFAVAGDFGCSKNAKNTIKNMNDKKPELVIPLGDLSYDKSANCWFDLVSPFNDRLKVTLGFHDVNDGESKLNQYEQTFSLKKHYDSFDYRHVHFVIMSSLSKFDQGSEQYKFINEDLKKASEDKEIDWIIVTTYNPFYTSPSKHTAEKDIRDIYHPMFEQYGVDLVLQAHNHNYQRTYPISFNPNDSSKPTVTNQFTTDYKSQTDGIVFAIVGTGGEGFYPLDGQASYTATQFDRFGFLNIEISNGNPHTKLLGTFYDNKGDEVRDQFTIEKAIKNLVDKT